MLEVFIFLIRSRVILLFPKLLPGGNLGEATTSIASKYEGNIEESTKNVSERW